MLNDIMCSLIFKIDDCDSINDPENNIFSYISKPF